MLFGGFTIGGFPLGDLSSLSDVDGRLDVRLITVSQNSFTDTIGAFMKSVDA